MLTGDKVETAVNIGYAAGLLDNNMDILIVEQETYNEIKMALEDKLKKQARHGGKRDPRSALVLSGFSFSLIQADKGLTDLLLRLTDLLGVILCCRVSPK